MFKRLTILTGILALGLMLGGCSKCGFWWDECPARRLQGRLPQIAVTPA